MSLRSRTAMALLAGVLLAGGAAHVWYWYGARWHAMDLGRARLLPEASEAVSSVWIPFPHQNLRSLASAVERPEELVAAVGRLVGREELAVPRLGGLGVPPAREALVSWVEEGDGPAVRLAIYPLARWVFRAAGTLAGNPLLAGGQVEEGLAVSWEDGVWRMGASFEGPDGADGGGVQPEADPEASTVWLRWRNADRDGPVPPGLYDLTAHGGALCLRPAGAALDVPRAPERVTLLTVERSEAGARFLALLRGEARSGVTALPGLVAGAPTREEAIESLPLHRWLERVDDLETVETERGFVVGTDREAVRAGVAVFEEWAGWIEAEGLGVAASLRPAEAAALTDAVADLLEDVPLTSRSVRRRWRDVTTLLEALTPFQRVCLAGGESGRG